MEVVFLVGSMTTDRTIDQHTESSYVLEPEGSERGLERVCVMSPRDESRVYVHVCTALYSLYCLLRHPARKSRYMTYTIIYLPSALALPTAVRVRVRVVLADSVTIGPLEAK